MSAPDQPTHTHASLAKALGVTVTTVKSYRRKFPEFWRVASQGKPIRFPAEALELAKRIKHHFRLGLSVEDIRLRLAKEFEAAPAAASPAAPGLLSSPSRETGLPGPIPAPEPLARVESLMEGLFTLQNRTHSLLAELVSKLDTLADHLCAFPAAPASPITSGGTAGPRAQVSTAFAAAPASLGARPGRVVSGLDPADSVAGARVAGAGIAPVKAPSDRDGSFSPHSATSGASAPRDGITRPAGRDAAGMRPPQFLLDMPVVVRSPEGDFLGVTSRSGKPFTLAQFETFLAGRGLGGHYQSSWLNQGPEWILRLTSRGQGQDQGQSQAHDHHFLQAVTPKGNTVARFASLSVGGKPASDAALQAFLRQVKDTLDQ